MVGQDLVLSDRLLELYFKIQVNKVIFNDDLKTLKKFLKYNRPFITNKSQLDRLLADKKVLQSQFDRLYPQVSKLQSLNSLSLEDLSKHTNLGVILTDDQDETTLPYFNINKQDQLDIQYTLSLKAQDNRSYLKNYLKHVFLNANEVAFYDKYIEDKSELDEFLELFPKEKRLKVLYPDDFKEQTRVKIQKISNQWSVVKNKVHSNKLHDRYIRIDSKIEIMLSSGIEFIFNVNKDLTCVFRCTK